MQKYNATWIQIQYFLVQTIWQQDTFHNMSYLSDRFGLIYVF